MKNQYERPEVLEIGSVERLTLGQPNKPTPDACDCAKDCPAEQAGC